MKSPYVQYSWNDFVSEKPEFQQIIFRWMTIAKRLAMHTCTQDDDLVGQIIHWSFIPTLIDLDDLLTLSHKDSPYGAIKILRSMYERIATAKYIVSKPSEAEAFIGYDPIDWDQILQQIKLESGIGLNPSEIAAKNLSEAVANAKTRYKQIPCEKCGLRKRQSWTALSVRDMSKQVALDHMFLNAFLLPSKLLHTTFYSFQTLSERYPPTYNTLMNAHELLIQLIFMHRRHFAKSSAWKGMMQRALRDFFTIWTVTQTDFDGFYSGERLLKKHKD